MIPIDAIHNLLLRNTKSFMAVAQVSTSNQGKFQDIHNHLKQLVHELMVDKRFHGAQVEKTEKVNLEYAIKSHANEFGRHTTLDVTK
jgi:hypothetical protein